MKRKTMIASLSLISALAGLSPAQAGEPPASAEQLRNEFESAVEANDTNALIALVNWQGVSDRMKNMMIPMIASLPKNHVVAEKLVPLPENFKLTNEMNGIRYRPNVEVAGQLEIEFDQKGNSMQIPYGKVGEAFYINGTVEEKITGAGSAEALARDKIEKARASFKDHPELASLKNDFGQTPLIQAAMNGDKDMVALLLASNVDINAGDNAGRTALHWAVDDGQTEVVALLIANKANVNARSNAGWTPLHEAAAFGKKDAADLLLSNHADINAKANDGRTPLHLAALYGAENVAEVLVASQADINARDNNGKTPLTAALDTSSLPRYVVELKSSDKKDVADFLRQHGGLE